MHPVSWASERELSPAPSGSRHAPPSAPVPGPRKRSRRSSSGFGGQGCASLACAPALGASAQFAGFDLCRMGAGILDDLRARWKISPKMHGLFLMMSTPADSCPDTVLKRMLASVVETCRASAHTGAPMFKYYVLVGKSGELYGLAEWAHEEASGRGITEGILAKFEYAPPDGGAGGARLTVEVMNTHAGTSFRFLAPALKALRDRGSIMLLGNFDYGNFTHSACWREVTALAHGRARAPRTTPPPPLPPPISLPIDWNLASDHGGAALASFDDHGMTSAGMMDAWGDGTFMQDAPVGILPNAPPLVLALAPPPFVPAARPLAHTAMGATPDANSVMESLRFMLSSWQTSVPGTPA